MIKLHFSIVIKGKVQGVFYRASAQQKAQTLGLTGYAQNQPDESVFVEAEGEQQALKSFVEWCKVGPTRAVVTEVLVTEGELKNHPDFSVRR
jgi:acylphosphatase